MIKFNEANEIVDKEIQQVVLVGGFFNKNIEYQMQELTRLAESAGLLVVAEVTQKITKVNSSTYIGKGKLLELAKMCNNMEIDVVVFNDELSGMQIRNIEEILNVKVIDRTILILDIFAMRANSKEGKLQVELAQLQYRKTRLIGFGKSLSRLGGGVGTRGPGEKKLEIDRRHIEKRIDDIKDEIKKINRIRNTQRASREKNEIPVIALVGYTNAGKSALMNVFLEEIDKVEKQVLSKDMLFATLDTKQRKIVLEENKNAILVDTVGFVSKLPHQLINAFKSTLDEIKYADLLIHVVDASYENYEMQIETTRKVLREIGVIEKNEIVVYNKMDLLENIEKSSILLDNNAFFISAKTGENIDKLKAKIIEVLFEDVNIRKLLIPFEDGKTLNYIYQNGKVKEQRYLESGIKLTVELKEKYLKKVEKYVFI